MRDNSSKENKLTELIDKIGDNMSHSVFRSIAQKFVLTPIETVILRKKGDDIQILLTKREAEDPDWGGQMHVPGTILRKSDFQEVNNYSKAFDRIQNKEIKTIFAEEPVFLGFWFSKVKRGVENAMIFLCKIDGNPKIGQFYSVNNLPKNIVKSQVGFINFAVKEVKERGLL